MIVIHKIKFPVSNQSEVWSIYNKLKLEDKKKRIKIPIVDRLNFIKENYFKEKPKSIFETYEKQIEDNPQNIRLVGYDKKEMEVFVLKISKNILAEFSRKVLNNQYQLKGQKLVLFGGDKSLIEIARSFFKVNWTEKEILVS